MSVDAPIGLGVGRRFARRIPWVKLAVCLAVVGGLGGVLSSAVRKARDAAHASTTI